MTAQTTNSENSLLHRLLTRGHSVSIERGRLVIESASGRPIPSDWREKNFPELTRQILMVTGSDAYLYCNHKTGRYGQKRYEGLTLQLLSVITQQEAHAICNVELTRARTTSAGAKGAPLPDGHFRIGKKHQLYRCWQSTDLPMPRRLSAMHDCIGKLRGTLFFANSTKGRTDGRLIMSTLMALNIPALAIRQAVFLDSAQTISRQAADNFRTRMPDKECAEGHQSRGLQQFPSTCKNIYGRTVISDHGNTAAPPPQSHRKAPQEQSVDEWLADYA